MVMLSPDDKGLKPIDLVLIEYYEISARSNKQAMLGSDPRVALGVAHVTDQQSIHHLLALGSIIIERSSFPNFEMLSHYHLVSVFPLRGILACTFYSHRWVLFRSERATAPAVETPLTHALFYFT
jgi:hypothetical protein